MESEYLRQDFDEILCLSLHSYYLQTFWIFQTDFFIAQLSPFVCPSSSNVLVPSTAPPLLLYSYIAWWCVTIAACYVTAIFVPLMFAFAAAPVAM